MSAAQKQKQQQEEVAEEGEETGRSGCCGSIGAAVGGWLRASRVSLWRGGAGADELRWRVDEDSRWVRRGFALPAIRKRIGFRVLSLCLSRACLGETISCSSYKMAPQKICVF